MPEIKFKSLNIYPLLKTPPFIWLLLYVILTSPFNIMYKYIFLDFWSNIISSSPYFASSNKKTHYSKSFLENSKFFKNQTYYKIGIYVV